MKQRPSSWPFPIPLAVACSAVLISCDSGGGAAADGRGDDSYPLDVCVVSGEPLDSMGSPVTLDHQGRVVKFCCSHCIAEFEKDPASHLAKLDAATRP